MKKVIIFGITQFGELVYNFLKTSDEYEVVGFTVDKKYIYKKSFFEKPVIEFENVENIWSPMEHEMMICIGYTDMNKIRQSKFEEAKRKGYHIAGYRHPSAIVLTNDIGDGNFIMEGAVVGQSCKIGDGNIIWPMAHIAHHTIVGNFNFFTISCAIAGNIKIGNNCVFGNNCTIKDGIKIEDYTLIGAAAYIRQNTEKKGVYVPAKSYQLVGKDSFQIKL